MRTFLPNDVLSHLTLYGKNVDLMENELTHGDATSEDRTQGQTPAPVRDIVAERLAARMKQQPQADEAAEEPTERDEVADAAPKPQAEPPLIIRKKIDIPNLFVEPAEADESDAEPLSPDLAEATEEMQTDAPEPTVEGGVAEGNRPQRERRGRGRDRRGRERRERPVHPEGLPTAASSEVSEAESSEPEPPAERASRTDREPRPERAPRGERPSRGDRPERAERPERGPRADRPDRPSRADRPTRSERPERSARPPRQEAPRVSGPKTAENAFPRARAMASHLGVSVVIPLFNEQESLRELVASVRDELYKLCDKNSEIILINDGSTDRSAEILRDIVEGTSRVTVMTFRHNLGKSAALAVGFREAKYGLVITMDADLQDDPKEFVNLIAKLDEGFDLVTGWKKKRNDPISKTLPSKLFNSVTSFFSGLKLHDFNCGLKAYRKEVTDSLDVYGEMHRYLPALAHWQGFKVAEIPVLHHPRKFGKSKFGTSRFFKGFLDLLTIIFTNRYGRRPLHFFGTIGTLLSIIGLAINGWVSIEWARGLTTLSNRPILLLGILLILVGVQLISIGLLGEMMVKNSMRPVEGSISRQRRAPRTSGGGRGGERRREA